MAEWRYLAYRLNGDGTETLIDPDLPLSDVSLTRVLSGPAGHSSRISPAVARLVGLDGQPLIERHSTAIYAEQDGSIESGCIVTDMGRQGPELTITGTGFAGFPKGKPYKGDKFFVQEDPLNIVRHIWEHIQSQPRGNLGVTLDAKKVGRLIGTKLEQVEFDTQAGPVSFEAGPYKLNWWETDDLGGRIDDLAEEQGFDYMESHEWSPSGDTVLHRISHGIPRIGVRRSDMRFVVGENVTAVPGENFTEAAYADEVIVRGAGEGRTMIQGYAARNGERRLFRPRVVEDKQIKSVKAANERARLELGRTTGQPEISELVVRDHDNAPIGGWSEGDEIEVMTDGEWGSQDTWYRVLSTTLTPDNASVATVSVMRADMISA
jgi:hypothetical protein